MRRLPIRWQLYPTYLVVILLSLGAVTWLATRSLNSFYFQLKASDLEARAWLIEEQIEELSVDSADVLRMDTICGRLGSKSDTRITVINSDGRVIGDSDHDPFTMDNHSNRPEVHSALNGEVGVETRFSHTLQQNMMYVAVPIQRQEETIGVVRTSLPTTALENALSHVVKTITFGGIAVALLVAGLSLIISRRISKPLEDMRQGAERFARGELEKHLQVPRSEELAALAESLNSMASQLDERIRTILRQRNEQEAVFSSISDGVLAVDEDQRLLSVNLTASNLVGIDPQLARGQNVAEAIANDNLRWFIARALTATGAIEDEILQQKNESKRVLQAVGTPLIDHSGVRRGAVIVLNDVTRIHQLETSRRDFVANVSHELRTPVTSIKGFVETLRDGAMNDPTDAAHFLDIIAKQAVRLENIIEDLLSLARIERQGESKDGLALIPCPVDNMLANVVQVCETNAQAKNISIDVEIEQDLTVLMDQPLLEQAVVNLVDNAIKYSDRDTRIEITAYQHENTVSINVKDQGCGIDAEHLPRLFERFYRVDKARSRRAGGTGLGLSIVKHISLTHGGHVTVESIPGDGSTFSIHLPAMEEDEWE